MLGRAFSIWAPPVAPGLLTAAGSWASVEALRVSPMTVERLTRLLTAAGSWVLMEALFGSPMTEERFMELVRRTSGGATLSRLCRTMRATERSRRPSSDLSPCTRAYSLRYSLCSCIGFCLGRVHCLKGARHAPLETPLQGQASDRVTSQHAAAGNSVLRQRLRSEHGAFMRAGICLLRGDADGAEPGKLLLGGLLALARLSNALFQARQLLIILRALLATIPTHQSSHVSRACKPGVMMPVKAAPKF